MYAGENQYNFFSMLKLAAYIKEQPEPNNQQAPVLREPETRSRFEFQTQDCTWQPVNTLLDNYERKEKTSPQTMSNTHVTIITIIITIISKATEGDITCTAVSTLDELKVTCSFGVDLSQTKHNINVQFYYPDITAGADTILMCNWLTLGTIKCHEGKDIRFDYVITDKVVIKGPPRQQCRGVYMCQVLPAMDVPVKPCNLSCRNITEGGELSDVTTTGVTSVTSSEPRESPEATNTYQVMAVITATLHSTIIIVIIVICRHRIRQTIREIRSQDQSQNPTENPERMDTAVELERMVPAGTEEAVEVTEETPATPFLFHEQIPRTEQSGDDATEIDTRGKWKKRLDRWFGSGNFSGSGGPKTDKDTQNTHTDREVTQEPEGAVEEMHQTESKKEREDRERKENNEQERTIKEEKKEKGTEEEKRKEKKKK